MCSAWAPRCTRSPRSCRRGAGRQKKQGMALAAIRVRASGGPSPGHGRHELGGTGRAQHGHGCRPGACKPAAGAPAPRETRSPAGVPDPVLQQVEHFGDPTITVNDAFRPVSRWFDRITRPEQLIATLPQVARVLTDPADAGPVVIALPQDVQAEEHDFPAAMFKSRLHRVPRPAPDIRSLADATSMLTGARRPLCSFSAVVRAIPGPVEALAFAEASRRARGRDGLPGAHSSLMLTRSTAAPWASSARRRPTHWPPRPTSCSRSGTRLQDFTTSSWTRLRHGRASGRRQRRPIRRGQAQQRCPSSATPANAAWRSTRRWATGPAQRNGAARAPPTRRPPGDKQNRRVAARRPDTGRLPSPTPR